ncbi:MAG: DUF4198 domain-containing protein [Helicobacteraceae bacterium]|jgi:cobalt/nickel transport protein|nr:DUF4198 domain-containing protein [Helicobacteraceae bacterium]
MRFTSKVALFAAIGLTPLFAHFQVVKTDKTVIENGDKGEIAISYEFAHPFEQELMNMVKPKDAGVFLDGKKTSFINSLKSATVNKQTVWSAQYKAKEPGVYQFYVDPAPYFEPAESKFIRHQTKTIVDVFGAGEGWDEPIGLKAEMIPLTRPYSILKGGLFSAQVLYKGKPVPNAEIEIEYYNEGKKLSAPNDMLITHVIKADSDGIFHVALPLEGWWGFAALIEDDETLTKDGKSYPIELGAVLWLKNASYK